VNDEASLDDVASAIMDTLDALVVVVAPDGRVLRVNRAVERLSGWSEDELRGRDFAGVFVRAEDAADARATFDAAIRKDRGTDTLRRGESRWMNRSGELRDIAWSTTAVLDASGAVRFAIGTGIDVTELRAADRRLRECLDVMVEGVCILEAVRDEQAAISDFVVRYLNPGARRMVTELGVGEPVRGPLQTGGADDLFPSFVRVVDDGTSFNQRAQVVRAEAALTFDVTGTRLDDGLVVTFRDVTALRQAEERLAFAATHDPLTGLANRPLLIDRLEHALVRRPGQPPVELAVFFLDLDGFKAVNDELGHQVGDVTLIRVARAIESVVRPADTVARFGGDEFVIVTEEVAAHTNAEALVKRLEAAVGDVAAGSLGLEASVGVALGGPDDTAESLLRRADEAMYRRKHLPR
jgi:diguanylate cyclase (GGDEF)-like protein/PAS domain S-box-containing protein